MHLRQRSKSKSFKGMHAVKSKCDLCVYGMHHIPICFQIVLGVLL